MAIKITPADVVGGILAAKSFLDPSSATGARGKLNEFLSEVRRSSIARTNLFEITIIPPRILVKDPTARILSLYGCDVNLPGTYLETLQLKRYGTGPNEKIPYSAQWNDLGFSFIGDGQGAVYKFFYKWLNGIVRSDTSMTENSVSISGLAPYEVEFKENYKTNIAITTFDEQQGKILAYELLDAYPIWLSETPMSWADTDNLQKIPVAFNFLQARLLNVDTTRSISQDGIRELSPFEKIYKAGTAVSAVLGMRKPRSVGDVINVVNNAKTIIKGMGGVF